MPSEKYQQIFENNKQWVQEKLNLDPDFFTNLSKDQSPDFLWIGCADSRVPANVVTGLEPGDIFVHRNIANLVVNADLNVHSVIQYAVEHLKVKHIIVCGHYECGGVKASMLQEDLGLLNNWLRYIRDVHRLHQEELDAISDEAKKYDRLAELNVVEQCINVIKTAFVQKSYVNSGYPLVHGWVYDLKTGLIKDLNINFSQILEKIRKIYKIG
ncbi:MAG: carbonic anhydrase [Bacteroidetes bacterium]|nr:carbonic anhydrase [Bacteroidota bacterium]